jgi:hypothetical protein
MRTQVRSLGTKERPKAEFDAIAGFRDRAKRCRKGCGATFRMQREQTCQQEGVVLGAAGGTSIAADEWKDHRQTIERVLLVEASPKTRERGPVEPLCEFFEVVD